MKLLAAAVAGVLLAQLAGLVTSPGLKPYQPTRLEWLETKLNAYDASRQNHSPSAFAPVAVKKVGTFPADKGWHMLRHSFASHCVAAAYHLREVQVWMGHSTIQVTERYAHLAPKKGSTDKLSDARLVQFYGTSTAPDPQNVVRLAEFQSKNSVVALPDLVTGPVFKTGGGR